MKLRNQKLWELWTQRWLYKAFWALGSTLEFYLLRIISLLVKGPISLSQFLHHESNISWIIMHITSTSTYSGWKLGRTPLELCVRCSEPGSWRLLHSQQPPFRSTPRHLPLYPQASAWNWPSFFLGREIWTNLSNPSVQDPPDGPETEYLCCLLRSLLSSREQIQSSCGHPAWEGRAPSFTTVACCLVRMSRVSLGCQSARWGKIAFQNRTCPPKPNGNSGPCLGFVFWAECWVNPLLLPTRTHCPSSG